MLHLLRCILVLVTAVLLTAVPFVAAAPNPLAMPTSTPRGPFHVAANELVDSAGIPFLIRGTQTTPFRISTAGDDARSTVDFGPHSATAFSAIRLRFNMNAVRIPADVRELGKPGYLPALINLVQLANRSDLLVILAASDPDSAMPSAAVLAFWKQCSVAFKDNPNILFDAFDSPQPAAVPDAVGDPHAAAGWEFWLHGGRSRSGTAVFGMEDVIREIRSSGARQPIVAMGWNDARLFQGFHGSASGDANVVYEVSPRYEFTRSDTERDAQFGFLASRVPLIANDWDLHLDDPKACAAVPQETEAASKLMLDSIGYFDAHRISWTVSTYTRGKLLEETVNLIPTKLEAGVTCGQTRSDIPGVGRLVLSRMFGTVEGKLVVVNISGGISLARGGYGIVYGRIMADRDSHDANPRPAYRLGGVSVQVTDSRNVTRAARMNWASAGWGNINFVVPSLSASGPGRLTIERVDGTRDSADIFIADTAPGLFTAMNCQGPALGSFTQSTRDGRRIASAPISGCTGSACSTVEIPVARGTTTTVRLVGNGFRHARSASEIEVTIAGVRVPVIAYGPAKDAGVDELFLAIPESLRGTGEADLICHVKGRLANVVRIAIAGSAS